MKNWWRTDKELMKSWWRTDEELMRNWWRNCDTGQRLQFLRCLITSWGRQMAKPRRAATSRLRENILNSRNLKTFQSVKPPVRQAPFLRTFWTILLSILDHPGPSWSSLLMTVPGGFLSTGVVYPIPDTDMKSRLPLDKGTSVDTPCDVNIENYKLDVFKGFHFLRNSKYVGE